jgi:PAS domain S-box-containing protein
VYAAFAWLLGDYPVARALFGNAALLAAPIAVCVVILRRRREWRGCQRLFWDTFGIGFALWAVGHAGWAYDSLVGGEPMPWLGWHTVFSLCGGIGPLIALVARPDRGVRMHAVGSVSFVLAGYGLFAVFLYSYFVLVPSLVQSDGQAYAALLTLVQVNRTVLFGAMLAGWWWARATTWAPAFACLALGAGTGFFLRIFTSMAIAQGTYQAGTLYDLAWILPLISYAMAAAGAPASIDDREQVDPPVRPVPVSVAALPVLVIPIVGYGWLFVQPLGVTGDAFRALLTGLVTLAGLALLTLRLASQGSELQRADAKLRLLAAATEQTGDLILITRADGSVELANDAFARALGYDTRSLGQHTFGDLVPPGGAGVLGEISDAVRREGVWRGSLVRRRADGSTFPVACTVVGLREETGRITHFVGVERDTTDELKRRDQLVHTERLSAMGELVAGVAHELNNPLQTIIGSVELMMEEQQDAAARRDLEVVRREAARAGQIVRNLLSFVRRAAPDRRLADLSDIVRSTVQLRQYHLRQRDIALTVEEPDGPLPVVANREEIQQIVLNLVLNAEHAVLSTGRGGTITVRARRAGANHVVEVADDGPGVDKEVGGRIFEPFFTTKDVGEGTGLGLSISHGIAQAHGGTLELCPGGPGACFRLTLPAPGVAAAAGSSPA